MPFLSHFANEIKELKNVPSTTKLLNTSAAMTNIVRFYADGVKTCSRCVDILNQANNRLEWKVHQALKSRSLTDA